MKLSGPQFEQLQAALLDAYTAFGLRQMLRVMRTDARTYPRLVIVL